MVLKQAKKLGIERVFLIDPKSPASFTSQRISEYMDGGNPRIVFDCNGSAMTNEIAINVDDSQSFLNENFLIKFFVQTTSIGGKVVLMKNSLDNHPIVLTDAVERGIDILSSQHGNHE